MVTERCVVSSVTTILFGPWNTTELLEANGIGGPGAAWEACSASDGVWAAAKTIRF